MDVKDRLAGMWTCIDDQTIAILREPLLRGKLLCNDDQMPDQLFVALRQRIHRVNMPVGDDQNMCWRNGVDVAEGRNLFVAVYIRARNFACDDLAKNTVGHEFLQSILWRGQRSVGWNADNIVILKLNGFVGLGVRG